MAAVKSSSSARMAGVYLGPYVPPHAHARQFTELLASPGTPIDPTANYTAAIVLKLKAGGEDALKNAVARTSDPQHADYGKFLTRTEVVALTAPPSDYVEAVQHWLEHGDCQGHGPQSSKIRATLSKGGDVIWVSGQIKDVESRFGTRLALFDHGERKAVRASMPLSAVPYCASQHMSFVTMNTPIQPGRARRGAKVSKSEKVDIEGTATLLTRSGKVHVKQLSRSSMLVGFRPHCVANLDDRGVPCARYTQRLRKLQVSFSQLEKRKRSRLHSFQWDNHSSSLSLSDVVCGRTFASSGVPCSSKYSCLCEVRIHGQGDTLLPVGRSLVAHVSQTSDDGATHSLGTSTPFEVKTLVTPSVLRNQYSWPAAAKGKHGSTQAVAEFYGEFFSNEDLSSFFTEIDEPVQSLAPTHVKGNLANDQGHAGGEASLDIQYLMGMAPEVPTFFYGYSDLNPYTPENEGFLTWLVDMGGEDDPPLVHSLSYGDVEADVFNTTNGAAPYAARVDLEFAKLSARGLSIIVASGDDGSAGFLARNDPVSGCAHAAPEWPASSPYVTTVGATQLASDGTQTYEVVCSAKEGGVITSGGGFSDIYSRPAWQDAAVKGYLKAGAGVPKPSFFNASGRAYPDITALGSRFLVFVDGAQVIPFRPRNKALLGPCAHAATHERASQTSILTRPSTTAVASPPSRSPDVATGGVEWHERLHACDRSDDLALQRRAQGRGASADGPRRAIFVPDARRAPHRLHRRERGQHCVPLG
jgi:subtilase family serine protease